MRIGELRLRSVAAQRGRERPERGRQLALPLRELRLCARLRKRARQRRQLPDGALPRRHCAVASFRARRGWSAGLQRCFARMKAEACSSPA